MRTFVSKITNTITIKTNQMKLTSIPVVGSLVQYSNKVGHFFIIFREVTTVVMFFFFFLSLLLWPFVCSEGCFFYIWIFMFSSHFIW
jgi:hypothetical protein